MGPEAVSWTQTVVTVGSLIVAACALAYRTSTDRTSDAVDGAVRDAENTVAMTEYGKKFDRIFKAIERQDETFRLHELSCTKFRTETNSNQVRTAEVLESLNRNVNNINRQLASIARDDSHSITRARISDGNKS